MVPSCRVAMLVPALLAIIAQIASARHIDRSSSWNGEPVGTDDGGVPAWHQGRTLLSAGTLQGCYRDLPCTLGKNYTSRDLAYLAGHLRPDLGMTLYKCQLLAAARQYRYAAVQYGTECYGGNDISTLQKAQATACNVRCSGNSSQTCGGTCLSTVVRLGTDIVAERTAWTDFRTDADPALAARPDDGPQLCGPGHRIVQWVLGLGTWGVDSARLLSVAGICSDGTTLSPAAGDTVRFPVAEAVKDPAVLRSPSGFTCAMLQEGGASDAWNPQDPSTYALSAFLGQGRVAAGRPTKPWAICGAITHPDWVAVGYSQRSGDVIEAMRFFLASTTMLNTSANIDLDNFTIVPDPTPAPVAAGTAPAAAPPQVVINNSSGGGGVSKAQIGGVVGGVAAGLGLVAVVLLIMKRTAVLAKLFGKKDKAADKPKPEAPPTQQAQSAQQAQQGVQAQSKPPPAPPLSSIVSMTGA